MACHLGEKQNFKDQNKIDLEIAYYHLTTNLAPRTSEGTRTTTTSYPPPLRSQVQEDIVADTDQVETVETDTDKETKKTQTQTYTKTESKTPNASKKSLSSIWDQPVHVGQSKGWSKTRLVRVYVDRWRRSRSVPSYPFRSGLFFCNYFDVDGTFDEHNYVYDLNENHFRVPGSWPCPCLASLPSLPPMAPSISSLQSSFRQGGTISDNDKRRHFCRTFL